MLATFGSMPLDFRAVMMAAMGTLPDNADLTREATVWGDDDDDDPAIDDDED